MPLFMNLSRMVMPVVLADGSTLRFSPYVDTFVPKANMSAALMELVSAGKMRFRNKTDEMDSSPPVAAEPIPEVITDTAPKDPPKTIAAVVVETTKVDLAQDGVKSDTSSGLHNQRDNVSPSAASAVVDGVKDSPIQDITTESEAMPVSPGDNDQQGRAVKRRR